MATCTICGKAGSQVPGVRSDFKIRLVAGETAVRSAGEATTSVALGTVGNFMAFGQREKVVVDLVRLPARCIDIVAIQAVD